MMPPMMPGQMPYRGHHHTAWVPLTGAIGKSAKSLNNYSWTRPIVLETDPSMHHEPESPGPLLVGAARFSSDANAFRRFVSTGPGGGVRMSYVGHYKRPPGRAPKGMVWDKQTGTWIPIPKENPLLKNLPPLTTPSTSSSTAYPSRPPGTPEQLEAILQSQHSSAPVPGSSGAPEHSSTPAARAPCGEQIAGNMQGAASGAP